MNKEINGIKAASAIGTCIGLGHLGASLATSASPILLGMAFAAIWTYTVIAVWPMFTSRWDLECLQRTSFEILVGNSVLGGLSALVSRAGTWLQALSPTAAAVVVLTGGAAGYLLRGPSKIHAAALLSGIAAMAVLLSAFPLLTYGLELMQAMLVSAQISFLVLATLKTRTPLGHADESFEEVGARCRPGLLEDLHIESLQESI